MLCRHGPHQVAQNSTTYTLPFSNLATGLPFTHFAGVMLGAISPTSIPAEATDETEKVDANAKRDQKTRFMRWIVRPLASNCFGAVMFQMKSLQPRPNGPGIARILGRFTAVKVSEEARPS